MTCTAGNMFRRHDKRAHGLLAFAMIVMIVVLAEQGTKNL